MNLLLFFRQSQKHLKGLIFPLCILFLFFAMLLFPSPVLSGASEGLLLWFNIVLPTLFPFILICNLCIRTSALSYLLRLTRPLLCRIFQVSPCGSFAVLAGFLCGYPMGSKVAADLYRGKQISQAECAYLISFCNNSSPMFIVSILVLQNLKASSMALPTLAILMVSPMLCSFLFRPGNRTAKNYPEQVSPYVPDSLNAGVLDRAVSDALEAIAKVGAYIIAFSVLTQLLAMLPFKHTLPKLLLLSSLELTKGISLICSSSLPWNYKYLFCLFLTSFGGFCAAAQTQSMLDGTGVSAASYLTKKLVTALVTSLLGCIFLLL